MEAPTPSQKYRRVFCFHCSRPIRLAPSILRREISVNQIGSEAKNEWFSRVFSHRCKTCGKEAIYSLNHVLDFEDQSGA